jgi:hypothetical protein
VIAEDCIMRSFLMYFHQIFSSDQTEKNKMGRACGIYKEEERRGEVHTEFRWGNLRERDHLGPRCRWQDNINLALKEVEWGAWTGLIWLGIGTGGGIS